MEKIEFVEELDIENSPYKKWIKNLTNNLLIPFEDYNLKKYFIKVANIECDNDNKRKTVIKFTPTISKEKYTENT